MAKKYNKLRKQISWLPWLYYSLLGIGCIGLGFLSMGKLGITIGLFGGAFISFFINRTIELLKST